jgi:SAM-dependent methyltransferase
MSAASGSPPEYAYDQSFAEERERLAGIERLWDPGTQAVMRRLGIRSGWRCLEVGAGGGAMVEWMADQVGPAGSVLATDVYTRFLEAIDRPNVEVREHDILAGGPLGAFDLVYARLVVEHLGSQALQRMTAAVRPGGLLLLEDYDWEAATTYPPQPEFDKVRETVLALMAEMGFEPNFGRRLPAELEAAGLENVEAEGRVRLIRGGMPETSFFRLSLDSLSGALLERGLLTEAEMEHARVGLADPSNTYLTPILVSAWGRAPSRDEA